MLHEKNWARAWLGWGFIWFLAAIALAPSNKLYQQGLILFLWLPTLGFAWSARHVYAQALRKQPGLWICVLALLLWCAISLAWSTAEDGAREGKRLVYILLFLLAFPLLAQAGVERVSRLLQVGGGLLALAALISIVQFYVVAGNPLVTRIEGIGEISHPILGAYVIAAAVLWLLYSFPRQRVLQLAWALALACLGAFVVFSQSRGAALAMVVSVVLAPLWFRNRSSGLFAVLAALATGIAFYLMFELIMLRGASYRPEIFHAAVQMIREHPVGGLGLGAFYRVEAAGLEFDHTHNMFTHIAVELGVPGMLLWLGVWLCTLVAILRARNTLFGKLLLVFWVYSTLAMQFDAASLTATPRAEWFISWLPVGLAMLLPWADDQNRRCGKIAGSI
ncbi:O-antigen ligase family protein [Pseudomonas sp. B21-023]|uniref:O-antigen ligase family protein n=1 Tax=unclassified Pseudomonas TaxID=196821 RepID=UPI00215E8A92|nr:MULTISPECIES: O-antigen ligase family protein [unclassified Pseudomonas]UVL19859.1 O-antigen ligase family protein [Pseudomonas sp. B21-044]UVM17242.1 O-antigen ligase family protein [Pseudomonas sp. B21-023]